MAQTINPFLLKGRPTETDLQIRESYREIGKRYPGPLGHLWQAELEEAERVDRFNAFCGDAGPQI